MMKGRFLHEDDMANKTKYAVIGRLVEKDLFKDENALGKYIHENGNSWRVVGVFQDEGGDRRRKKIVCSIYYSTKNEKH